MHGPAKARATGALIVQKELAGKLNHHVSCDTYAPLRTLEGLRLGLKISLRAWIRRGTYERPQTVNLVLFRIDRISKQQHPGGDV